MAQTNDKTCIECGYTLGWFWAGCSTCSKARQDGLWPAVMPACSAKVCGTECAELRARHRELKSELLEAQDQIAALGEERDALRGELGDTQGDRDSWRIRAERAEKAIDLIRGRK